MASIDDIKLNTVIKFKTYNTTDPNTYLGIVKAFMTYDVVRPYFDVDAYYNSVANIVGISNIVSKEELTYFQLNQYGTDEKIYMAKEWINPFTLLIIDKLGSLNLDIVNVSESDINNILSILASNGYYGIVKYFNEEINYG